MRLLILIPCAAVSALTVLTTPWPTVDQLFHPYSSPPMENRFLDFAHFAQTNEPR